MPVRKGQDFSKRESHYFIFGSESGTGTKAWPEKSFKFQINSIYKKISLYMYTNTIAVWSLTCTIVKCVSHQIVYYWTIKYVKSKGTKKNYKLISNL